jgi:hypothetical protein
MIMKALGTALASLTLAFSGNAMADRDDLRRHGYHGGHHHKHGGHWKHRERHHHHHHYYGASVRYGYYPAPVYAPAPYYGYAPHPHYRHHDGVTIILPPVRIGF